MFKIYFFLPLLIPIALMKRDFSGGLINRIERWGIRVAARPGRAIALVGIVSLILNVTLALCTRIPVPQVGDEFGYLLLGDTFAHGRVTNPTPPLWQHFETLHEIVRPTYTGKYPPGQGLVLAVGEKLGQPIIGVWFATALVCAIMCWMLMGWMAPRWALAGGLMVAFHPQILAWSQNYWGGTVAMGGGALVLGAFRRMLRECRVRDSLCMGVGLGILANSRPYEGFVLGLLTLMALLMWAIQAEDVPASIIFRRVFAPMLVVLVLFGAQIAYYNWRVTGNPVQMPYMVHEDTYGIAPVFLFGTPRPEPTYLHADIRKFQEDCLAYFLSQRASFGALARAIGTKMWTLGQAYLWSYLMVLPLLALPWSLARDRWLWFALFMGLVFAITMMMSTWVYPHYAAPAAALFFVLVTQSMRRLHAWHIGTWRVGRNLVRGLAVLCVVSFFVVEGKVAAKDDRPSWYFLRQTMLKKLQALPQKSLVIVRYSKDHNPNREWVYNEANILGSKVILARDMGVENKELLDYFPDRKAWMVDADAADPQPEPITGS